MYDKLKSAAWFRRQRGLGGPLLVPGGGLKFAVEDNNRGEGSPRTGPDDRAAKMAVQDRRNQLSRLRCKRHK